MKKTMLFISFYDSFEENIISYLNEYFTVTKMTYEEIKLSSSSFLLFDSYCFGPGPGHVREYLGHCCEFIEKIHHINKPLVGICLGHQLLLVVLKMAILVRSSNPVHGQSVILKDADSSLVARYNSWTVKLQEKYLGGCIFDEFDEVASFRNNQILTMQFHPESVGTSCPEKFFSMISDFVLHNISDERF